MQWAEAETLLRMRHDAEAGLRTQWCVNRIATRSPCMAYASILLPTFYFLLPTSYIPLPASPAPSVWPTPPSVTNSGSVLLTGGALHANGRMLESRVGSRDLQRSMADMATSLGSFTSQQQERRRKLEA